MTIDYLRITAPLQNNTSGNDRNSLLSAGGGTMRSGRRGSAIFEFAVVAPVLFPLLLALVNFGINACAFISVENAARVAAIRNSGGMESAADQNTACAMAIEELRGLPGIDSSFASSCTDAPVAVASTLCDSDTPCTPGAGSADGSSAVLVTVSYSMPDVFRLPLVGPSVITRSAQMRVRSNQ